MVNFPYSTFFSLTAIDSVMEESITGQSGLNSVVIQFCKIWGLSDNSSFKPVFLKTQFPGAELLEIRHPAVYRQFYEAPTTFFVISTKYPHHHVL